MIGLQGLTTMSWERAFDRISMLPNQMAWSTWLGGILNRR